MATYGPHVGYTRTLFTRDSPNVWFVCVPRLCRTAYSLATPRRHLPGL